MLVACIEANSGRKRWSKGMTRILIVLCTNFWEGALENCSLTEWIPIDGDSR